MSCVFFAADSLSEALCRPAKIFPEAAKLVRKVDPILGSKKRTPKWGPFWSFHFNSYCNNTVDPILGSVFWTPKWGPRFGPILHLQGNRECSLWCAKSVWKPSRGKEKKKIFQTDDFPRICCLRYTCAHAPQNWGGPAMWPRFSWQFPAPVLGATFSSTFHSARVSHHKPRVLLQVLSYSARVPHHKHRVLLGTSVTMRGSDTINLGSSITVRGSDTINLGSSFTVRGSDTTNLGSSSGPPLECAGPTPRLGFTMFYNSDKRIQSMRSTASSRTSDMFLVPDLQPRTH